MAKTRVRKNVVGLIKHRVNEYTKGVNEIDTHEVEGSK